MNNVNAIVKAYLDELRRIRATGEAVAETSYYGAMQDLFNAVGGTLNPPVFCVVNLRNRGAGIPDGGLFTADQQGAGIDQSGFSQKPARGVIEAKPTSADVHNIASSKQVEKYLKGYGQVIVTNLYQFLLVTRGADGSAIPGEIYSLASNEAAFWSARPADLIAEHAEGLCSFLQHIMLLAAPLSEPQDVANVLAFYAREAMTRIERGGVDLSVLDAIREDFEKGLGITFKAKEGDHFFRSTLVQTLFYGIFSAWVLWSEEQTHPGTEVSFDWRVSGYYLHVPVIQALFERLAIPSKLRTLDLMQVLDWTGTALNRVDRATFFSQFNTGEAVQYFYEPFLEAFDPELRKDLGVWYTPPEIVQYMVERVDRVLREELDIADGLADDSVYVLDPACGTGTYLVAVLNHIYRTRANSYGAAAGGNAARDAIRNAVGQSPRGRVFGFEILPAPFVVAHLQLGLLLQRLGVPLHGEGERAGIYLTNSLTGWTPPEGQPQQLVIQALQQERDEADQIKRGRKILVVIGNPPYNAFAGTTTREEDIVKGEGLVDRYKQGLRERWGIKKYNLDDLYIRFFRIAERCIAEMRGVGVICFISNFSYLGDPSFVVMREHLVQEFDKFWFDSLNGDSRETGKRTPWGTADPSVFSTEYNKAGIRTGTTVGLMVRRKAGRTGTPIVLYRDFWGVNKRRELLDSLSDPGGKNKTTTDLEAAYKAAVPSSENRYSFRPLDISADYTSWPLVTELCAEPPNNGLMEKRGGALIDIDRDALEKRMRLYYDPSVNWEKLEALQTGLTDDAARFDAKKARDKVLKAETYIPNRVLRYLIRPFDTRWCYYSAVRPLWNEPRPTLWAQSWEGNSFFVTRPAGVADPEGIPVFFTGLLGDNDFQRGHSYYFPLHLRIDPSAKKQSAAQIDFFGQVDAEEPQVRANLSSQAREYLKTLGIVDPDTDPEAAALIWMHALATGYAPQYLGENEDGIQTNWPRIPLPASADLLYQSAQLGAQVAALLDTERDVPGVTSGAIREELRRIGWLVGNNLAVTARWGYHSGGAVMPGLGDAREREYTSEELTAIEQGGQTLGLGLDDTLALLGDTTYDLHLNDTTCWANIPAQVYAYTIGGYQVIKKWLSYRHQDVLGRALHEREALEVTQMARRIAALILLQPTLNTSYRAVKESTYAWSKRVE